MILACMSWDGLGTYEIIHGKLTGNGYKEIFERNLFVSKRKVELNRNFIFQQDGDPKHTCKLMKDWFVKHKVKVMKWPPQ